MPRGQQGCQVGVAGNHCLKDLRVFVPVGARAGQIRRGEQQRRAFAQRSHHFLQHAVCGNGAQYLVEARIQLDKALRLTAVDSVIAFLQHLFEFLDQCRVAALGGQLGIEAFQRGAHLHHLAGDIG